MDDYLKFKKLLAWFVNQLNVNNGIINGERVTGRGYNDSSSLRKYYADCRNYTEFDLDCTIAHKYGNYATTSNYINLAGTDLNTIPEFDRASKAVTSLYIGIHSPMKPIDRKSDSISVASLGLEDAEPNQALRDFFDIFKRQILEYKSSLNTDSADCSAKAFGRILKNMYDSAGRGEKVLKIHLFGIEYGHIITANNVKVSEIVSEAGLNHSYVIEVSKGIGIGAEMQKNSVGKISGAAHALDGADISYWFVGARWGSADMTEAFISNGYWENGYDDKYIDEVNSVKIGDKIAIKSVYTRKNTVAFDPHGNTVSCMGIKAIGTVTGNYNNGKRIDVDWQALNPIKEWYLFTYFKTIWEVKPADGWMQQALVDFTFYNEKQDITRFRNAPFWAERFGDDIDDVDDVAESMEDVGVPPYSKDDFLKEVYITPNQYEDMVQLLERKKNIILQGAPGVGKSFLARKLAYSLMGAQDERRIKMIQFHQSYSYEDFIRGYRPNGDGKFDLIDGVFYEFCGRAEKNSEHGYYFIIDEINRGNISKIFGELMILIEHDKRGAKHRMHTTYDRENDPEFSVPENVYIIGMMNTADRSLALPDYALRRRFSFVNVDPAFDSSGFKRDFRYAERQAVIDTMNELNTFIVGEGKLDKGHKIGHSYFCKFDGEGNPIEFTHGEIQNVFRYEIKPMLEEYFVDDEELLNDALKIINKWLPA